VHAAGENNWNTRFVELLSLSYERNVPTWYASCVLFSCALALSAIASGATGRGIVSRKHWWGLAAGFLFISMDEVVGLHEQLGPLFRLSGVLYFSWVVPAGITVLLLAILYVPFLLRLEASLRRQCVLAGALYVTAALLMELPLGYWTERAGNDNLTYAVIDWVEETLEIFGATLFLIALSDHRRVADALLVRRLHLVRRQEANLETAPVSSLGMRRCTRDSWQRRGTSPRR
jgi:hypothetical protein